MSSPQHKMAHAFIGSFNTRDITTRLALRTDDCIQTMAPSSLFHGHVVNNSQFAAQVSHLYSVFSEITMTAKEIFAHNDSNQVTIWASSHAVFREDARDEEDDSEWVYRGEYVFVLTLNQEGDKIERVLEFGDSLEGARVMKLMPRARRNLAAKQNVNVATVGS